MRRGIAPQVIGGRIDSVIVRERRLRLPVSANLRARILGRRVLDVRRRGKYLIFDIGGDAIIAHLGMSGIFYFSSSPPQQKHEHIGLKIGGQFLIYRDPRRFGCFVYGVGAGESHPLLQKLGPEPLSAKFTGKVLRSALGHRQTPIKTALLNGAIVAGIGNIYASESLHLARIRPQTAAGTLSVVRAERLAAAIKTTLKKAIAAGGSSMRDFSHPNHEAGYFQTQWRVYERGGGDCNCGGRIVRIVQGGRATYYCPRCQK